MAAIADTPQVMAQGSWRLGVFIDAAAWATPGSELNVARATRSSIDAFGIASEGKSAFTTSDLAWSA
jgi:hypothetical protein